jgi:hypothetical protein
MVVGGGWEWEREWGGGTVLGVVGEADEGLDGPPTEYGGRVAGGIPKGPREEGPIFPGWWTMEDDWIGRLDERAPARELPLVAGG